MTDVSKALGDFFRRIGEACRAFPIKHQLHLDVIPRLARPRRLVQKIQPLRHLPPRSAARPQALHHRH